MMEYLQVVTTVSDAEEAQSICHAVVEQRLSACAQVIGPIASVYWWQGQVETAQEWLCVLKTRSDLYKELERALKVLHPYEEPEILAIPVAAGSSTYLSWMDQVLRR